MAALRSTDGGDHGQEEGRRLRADGAVAGAAKTYTDEDGDEHLYYGSGFVQIAWWSNYASAGVMLGRGLELFAQAFERVLLASRLKKAP